MRVAALALLTSLALAAPAFAAPGDALGRWRVAAGDGVIEVAPCGASVCGTLVEAAAPPGQTDENNPDESLRGRPVIGLRMLWGFRETETGWVEGRIYDPKSGRTYRAELKPDGADRLKLKGCVLGTPFCRTETWTRVD